MFRSRHPFVAARRNVLRGGAAAAALTLGGCCAFPRVPGSNGAIQGAPPRYRALFDPGAAPSTTDPIVDAHAHFFNAADVPVRGFIAECVAHDLPPLLEPIVASLAYIADALARAAPSAAEELAEVESWHVGARSLAPEQIERSTNARLDVLRAETAARLSETIAGSEFERRVRAADGKRAGVGARRGATFSRDEILEKVQAREVPAGPKRAQAADPGVAAADGALAFVFYMLSHRASNLHTYRRAYTTHPDAFGTDIVIGALVDFDRWLQCPPRSPHADQVRLHAVLSQTWGGYMRPLVSYNPWTDIEESGAARARVIDAVQRLGFVGVKIYPPMGYFPSDNASTPLATRKRRPPLQALDDALDAFFGTCADLGVPVLAHTSASNGRDDAHDALGGPEGWARRLQRHAADARVPVISFGHFGGDGAGKRPNDWTTGFADLMAAHPAAGLYGDLGYWDGLNCAEGDAAGCEASWKRLRAVLTRPIGGNAAVADRVMFGTDWLMLSMVDGWADYPARLRAGFDEPTAARIFGRNAQACFAKR